MGPGRLAALLLVLALASTLTLLAVAPPAAAHADFISSSPAPFAVLGAAPASVRVTVSEAVEPGTPTLTVINRNGTRVDVGPAVLSPTDPTSFSVDLEPGIGPDVYTVTWSVVSADDGHLTAGSFYFMVAYPDGALPGAFPVTGTITQTQAVPPLDVVLEGIGFIAFSVAFGGLLLTALLWLPAGWDLGDEALAGPQDGLRALLQMSSLAALIFAGVACARLAENLAAYPPGGWGAAFGSTFVLSLLGQLLLGIGLAALLARIRKRPSPADAFHETPWEFLPAIFFGFLLILLEAAISHSASAAGWWPLAPIADAVHLCGAALWIGGLAAVLRTRRWLREPTPPEFARAVLAGFSRFALLGVFLVVSAGVILAYVLVGSVNGLVGTTYGWVILAKGALLVPMVVLGAWNRATLRRAEAGAPATWAAVRRLAANVRGETACGVAVLLLAGLLVTMNPAAAPQPLNPTFILNTTAGGLFGIFQVNPWPTGPGVYVFQIVVYYAGNETAYYGGGNATMSFLREGGNGTAVPIPMEGPHGNHYVILNSPVLAVAGTWDIRVSLAGPQGTPVSLPYTVTISP